MKIRDIAPENNYVCIETANGDLVNFDVFEYGEADDYESIKKIGDTNLTNLHNDAKDVYDFIVSHGADECDADTIEVYLTSEHETVYVVSWW